MNKITRAALAVTLGFAVSLPAMAEQQRRFVQSSAPVNTEPVRLPMLNDMGGNYFTGAGQGNGGFTATTNTRFVPQAAVTEPNNVPEPGTLALSGVLLAGLAALRRRRNP